MVLLPAKRWKSMLRYILIILSLMLISCSKTEKSQNDEIILARVGETSISLDEFMRRTEYTIRPAYCNGSNNIHKKIILNSLIAEKMMALEAGKMNDLDQSKQFQLYLQGRQEQAMREWLLHEEGFEKVQLKDSEIQKVFNVAGRKYNVQYYTIPDNNVAKMAKEKIEKNELGFEEVHDQLWPDEEIPQRTVEWKTYENKKIIDALFYDQVTDNSVIGPLKIGENDHIVIKVTGWTDELAISDNDRKDRWNQVKETLKKNKALEIYDKFVVSIMEGKRLDFDAGTFNKVVNLIGPLYVRSSQEKRDLYLDAVFNRKGEDPEMNQLSEGIEGLLDEPLLRIEGEVWSVGKFKEEILKHPLVFRKNLPDDTKFAEQFRLAIVDMIRDKYLAEEAYKRGYQDVSLVKRYTQMWHDALIAQHQKNLYLQTIPNLPDSMNTVVLLEEYLNPYVTQLQKKYSDQIKVNVEAFNNIQLARLDMIVMQTNVPFPIMVPSFPQLTTKNELDYGKKMN
jgi:hypothetical protein